MGVFRGGDGIVISDDEWMATEGSRPKWMHILSGSFTCRNLSNPIQGNLLRNLAFIASYDIVT